MIKKEDDIKDNFITFYTDYKKDLLPIILSSNFTKNKNIINYTGKLENIIEIFNEIFKDFQIEPEFDYLSFKVLQETKNKISGLNIYDINSHSSEIDKQDIFKKIFESMVKINDDIFINSINGYYTIIEMLDNAKRDIYISPINNLIKNKLRITDGIPSEGIPKPTEPGLNVKYSNYFVLTHIFYNKQFENIKNLILKIYDKTINDNTVLIIPFKDELFMFYIYKKYIDTEHFIYQLFRFDLNNGTNPLYQYNISTDLEQGKLNIINILIYTAFYFNINDKITLYKNIDSYILYINTFNNITLYSNILLELLNKNYDEFIQKINIDIDTKKELNSIINNIKEQKYDITFNDINTIQDIDKILITTINEKITFIKQNSIINKNLDEFIKIIINCRETIKKINLNDANTLSVALESNQTRSMLTQNATQNILKNRTRAPKRRLPAARQLNIPNKSTTSQSTLLLNNESYLNKIKSLYEYIKETINTSIQKTEPLNIFDIETLDNKIKITLNYKLNTTQIKDITDKITTQIKDIKEKKVKPTEKPKILTQEYQQLILHNLSKLLYIIFKINILDINKETDYITEENNIININTSNIINKEIEKEKELTDELKNKYYEKLYDDYKNKLSKIINTFDCLFTEIIYDVKCDKTRELNIDDLKDIKEILQDEKIIFLKNQIEKIQTIKNNITLSKDNLNIFISNVTEQNKEIITKLNENIPININKIEMYNEINISEDFLDYETFHNIFKYLIYYSIKDINSIKDIKINDFMTKFDFNQTINNFSKLLKLSLSKTNELKQNILFVNNNNYLNFKFGKNNSLLYLNILYPSILILLHYYLQVNKITTNHEITINKFYNYYYNNTLDNSYDFFKNILQIPNISIIFIYKAFMMFINNYDEKTGDFKLSNIINIQNYNSLTFLNYIYVFLNSINKNYNKIFDMNNTLIQKISINSDISKLYKKDTTLNIIEPIDYNKQIQNIYQIILNNFYKNPLDNKLYINYAFEPKKIESIINKLSDDKNLSEKGFLHAPQVYKFMKDNIEYIIKNNKISLEEIGDKKSDNTVIDKFYMNIIDMNNINYNIDKIKNHKIKSKFFIMYIPLETDKTIRYNLSRYNWENFNYKDSKYFDYINNNSFLPFSYTYDQFIDNVNMCNTKIYNENNTENKIENFETIRNNIYKYFDIQNKETKIINKDEEDDEEEVDEKEKIKYINLLTEKDTNTITNQLTSIYILYGELYNKIKNTESLKKQEELFNNIVNQVLLIKDNIFEYAKIYIHRFVSLFNFLNLSMTSNIFSMIKDNLILNYLSTYYSYIKQLNYTEYIEKYKDIYNYFVFLKLLKPESENIDNINDKQIVAKSIKEDLKNNNKMYLINDKNTYYQTCTKTSIKDSILSYLNNMLLYINTIINGKTKSNIIDESIQNIYLKIINNGGQIQYIITQLKFNHNYIFEDIIQYIMNNIYKTIQKEDEKKEILNKLKGNIDITIINDINDKNKSKQLTDTIKLEGGLINFIFNKLQELTSEKSIIQPENKPGNKPGNPNTVSTEPASDFVKALNRRRQKVDQKGGENKNTIYNFIKQIFENINDNEKNNIDDTYTNLYNSINSVIEEINKEIENYNKPLKEQEKINKLTPDNFKSVKTFINKMYIFYKNYEQIKEIQEQLKEQLKDIQVINVDVMSYLKVKPINPTIIDFNYEINYYIKKQILNQKGKEDYLSSMVFFENYINNCFSIFTQLYQSLINKTSLDYIVKYDFSNILPLIENKADFKKYFNNEFNNMNVLFKHYISFNINPSLQYNKIIEHIYYNLIYSLFTSKDYKIIDNKALKPNLDTKEITTDTEEKTIKELKDLYDNIKNNDIPTISYYYYQIPLLLTGQTPYNFIENIKEMYGIEEYNKMKYIFNENIKTLPINVLLYKTHYVILIVLYNLGLLDELITPETKEFLINKYKDIQEETVKDIILLLRNDENNIIPYNCNINLTHKAQYNFIKDIEKSMKIIESSSSIKIDDPILKYYKKINCKYIEYDNNHIILNINNNVYIYQNVINNVNITLNKFNLSQNSEIILFKNKDDIIIEFKDKLIYSDIGYNHCFFHLNKDEKTGNYADYIIIENNKYDIANIQYSNLTDLLKDNPTIQQLSIYDNVNSTLILTKDNNYYLLYFNFNGQTGIIKNIFYHDNNVYTTHMKTDDINVKYQLDQNIHVIEFNYFTLIKLSYNLLSLSSNNLTLYNKALNTLNNLQLNSNNILNNPYYKIFSKAPKNYINTNVKIPEFNKNIKYLIDIIDNNKINTFNNISLFVFYNLSWLYEDNFNIKDNNLKDDFEKIKNIKFTGDQNINNNINTYIEKYINQPICEVKDSTTDINVYFEKVIKYFYYYITKYNKNNDDIIELNKDKFFIIDNIINHYTNKTGITDDNIVKLYIDLYYYYLIIKINDDTILKYIVMLIYFIYNEKIKGKIQIDQTCEIFLNKLILTQINNQDKNINNVSVDSFIENIYLKCMKDIYINYLNDTVSKKEIKNTYTEEIENITDISTLNKFLFLIIDDIKSDKTFEIIPYILQQNENDTFNNINSYNKLFDENGKLKPKIKYEKIIDYVNIIISLLNDKKILLTKINSMLNKINIKSDKIKNYEGDIKYNNIIQTLQKYILLIKKEYNITNSISVNKIEIENLIKNTVSIKEQIDTYINEELTKLQNSRNIKIINNLLNNIKLLYNNLVDNKEKYLYAYKKEYIFLFEESVPEIIKNKIALKKYTLDLNYINESDIPSNYLTCYILLYLPLKNKYIKNITNKVIFNKLIENINNSINQSFDINNEINILLKNITDITDIKNVLKNILKKSNIKNILTKNIILNNKEIYIYHSIDHFNTIDTLPLQGSYEFEKEDIINSFIEHLINDAYDQIDSSLINQQNSGISFETIQDSEKDTEFSIDTIQHITPNIIIKLLYNEYTKLNSQYKQLLNVSYYDFIKSHLIDYYNMLYCYTFINDIYNKYISNIKDPDLSTNLCKSFYDIITVIINLCNSYNKIYTDLNVLKSSSNYVLNIQSEIKEKIIDENDKNKIITKNLQIGCPQLNTNIFNVKYYNELKNTMADYVNLDTCIKMIPNFKFDNSNSFINDITCYNLNYLYKYTLLNIKCLYFTQFKSIIYKLVEYDSKNNYYIINSYVYSYVHDLINATKENKADTSNSDRTTFSLQYNIIECIGQINDKTQEINKIKLNEFDNTIIVLLYIIFKWLDNDINLYYDRTKINQYTNTSYKYINYVSNLITDQFSNNIIIETCLRQLYKECYSNKADSSNISNFYSKLNVKLNNTSIENKYKKIITCYLDNLNNSNISNLTSINEHLTDDFINSDNITDDIVKIIDNNIKQKNNEIFKIKKVDEDKLTTFNEDELNIYNKLIEEYPQTIIDDKILKTFDENYRKTYNKLINIYYQSYYQSIIKNLEQFDEEFSNICILLEEFKEKIKDEGNKTIITPAIKSDKSKDKINLDKPRRILLYKLLIPESIYNLNTKKVKYYIEYLNNNEINPNNLNSTNSTIKIMEYYNLIEELNQSRFKNNKKIFSYNEDSKCIILTLSLFDNKTKHKITSKFKVLDFIKIKNMNYKNNLIDIENIKDIPYEKQVIQDINKLISLKYNENIIVNGETINYIDTQKEEFLKYWNIYYKENQIRMFEIFFGHFIRPEQRELLNIMYNEIVNNNDDTKQNQYCIHNLVMGGGKSSVLTPLLTMLIELHSMPFIVILPEHLVKDTVLPLLQYRPLYRRNLRYIEDVSNLNEVMKLVIDPQFNYVLSDTQFKYWKLLMHKYNKTPDKILRQFYLLFDEIDSILDPIKSNFNKINTTSTIDEYIKEKYQVLYYIYLTELFKLNKQVDKTYINNYINVYDDNLFNSYTFIKTLDYGVNYGFSTIESHGNMFVGVPYEHANKPIKNSYFTELTHTIIATLLCYVNVYNADERRKEDIENYVSLTDNNRFIITKDHKLENLTKEEIIKEFIVNNKIYFDYILDRITENLKQTILFDNISSVDIIGKNVSLYKSAYSGTVNFDLPLFYTLEPNKERDEKEIKEEEKQKIETLKDNGISSYEDEQIITDNIDYIKLKLKSIDNNYEFIKINPDNDSITKTYAGLMGMPNIYDHSIYYYNNVYDIEYNKDIKEKSKKEELKPSEKQPCLKQDSILLNQIKNIKDFKSIFELIGYKYDKTIVNKQTGKQDKIKTLKYTALIDAGALFKNFNINIMVKLIYKYINDGFEKENTYNVVFVDGNNNKKVYTGIGEPILFDGNPKDTYFYYYDNQHIVGTDLKQPTNLYGLITMSYLNSYTNIAQASFRLRNMCKGHTIDYILSENVDKSDKIKEKYNDFINSLQKDFNTLLDNKKTELIYTTDEEKEKYIIYLKYKYILYYLLLMDEYQKNNKLNYLFNQNILYYYKLCDKKIYSLNNINNLFLVLNNKDKIKVIQTYNDKQSYYKNKFYYLPNNGNIKTFILKYKDNKEDEFLPITQNDKENIIIQLLNSIITVDGKEIKPYELLSKSKNILNKQLDKSISIDTSSDQQKSQEKDEDEDEDEDEDQDEDQNTDIQLNSLIDGIKKDEFLLKDFSCNENKFKLINDSIKGKVNYINNLYYYNYYNPNISICVKCKEKIEDKTEKYYLIIDLYQYLLHKGFGLHNKKNIEIDIEPISLYDKYILYNMLSGINMNDISYLNYMIKPCNCYNYENIINDTFIINTIKMYKLNTLSHKDIYNIIDLDEDIETETYKQKYLYKFVQININKGIQNYDAQYNEDDSKKLSELDIYKENINYIPLLNNKIGKFLLYITDDYYLISNKYNEDKNNYVLTTNIDLTNKHKQIIFNLITKRLKNIIQNSNQYDLYTFYNIILNSFLKDKFIKI